MLAAWPSTTLKAAAGSALPSLTWLLSRGACWPNSQRAEGSEFHVGQSSTSTDDVTVSCAPGCKVMPDQARLSAGLRGDSENTMPITVTSCRMSEPTEAMTSGEAECSTMEPPPAGLARNVSGCESGKSRPDSRSVPLTLQTIDPAVLLAHASLLIRSDSFGSSQCAVRKTNTAQARSMRAFKGITIIRPGI